MYQLDRTDIGKRFLPKTGCKNGIFGQNDIRHNDVGQNDVGQKVTLDKVTLDKTTLDDVTLKHDIR